MNLLRKTTAVAVASAAFAAALSGCGNGSADSSSTVTVAGEVALAYVKRPNTIGMNPTNGAPSAPGGDLMIREKSSASAPEHNVTAQMTQGAGDVSDPEVSYDGSKIVFAMRCPASNTATIRRKQPACTGRWNIWEYEMLEGKLTGGTLPPADALDRRRRRRSGVFAGRPRLRVLVEPPDQDEDEPGTGPELLRTRRIRARARLQSAHDDGDRHRHRADLGQPEPRPQPGGAAQRRHHVRALGARRRPQPLRDLPHQARRHRHVRAVRRAFAGQQLPAPARHGPERQIQGASCRRR